MDSTAGARGKMSLTRVIRSAMLLGLETAATDVGLNALALLNAVNLPRDCMTRPDGLISADAVNRLLEIASEESGYTDFGFRASVARGLPDLGLATLLVREEETLADALRALASNIHLHGNSTFIEFDEHVGLPILSFRIATSVVGIQATEFCGCGVVQLVRWLVGPSWTPATMCFAHTQPRHTSLQRKFYRTELRYGQLMSGVVFKKEDLDIRINSAPASLRERAKRILESQSAATHEPFEAQVARLIMHLLPYDRCSADNIADALQIDRRTLSRRLGTKGLTYSSLLNQVRSEIAISHVGGGDMALTDVAQAVGFTSLSTFSRWFQSMFACSASSWRENHRHSLISDAGRIA
ncbi:AraC family transcriptional regulator [Paraburkholderia caribensis]|uniref:AraC family transcriptional regulator n=1 Tax=Paraburkholderia caribensis TaxID=75105 RepID=UPI0031D7012D